MFYTLLADLVVALHVFYVAYVLLGELVILFGLAFRWGWARNRWFRLTHLTAILIVAVEAMASVECPLTTWEDNLRAMGGQTVTEGTFIGRIMHGVLYYDAPPWVFTAAYISFAVLVLGTLFLAPPRWRKGIAVQHHQSDATEKGPTASAAIANRPASSSSRVRAGTPIPPAGPARQK